MKLIFKTILKYYLKFLVRLTVFVHRPKIIAIAGTENKTFIKNDILETLKNKGVSARGHKKSFNTEIGLPLAILNLPSGYNFYKKWLPIIFKAPGVLFSKFPKYLVLEFGVSDPGDMKYLLSLIRPQVVIVGEITQRYLDSFSGMDKVTDEYRYLVKSVPRNGIVIFNTDNKKIKELIKDARARKVLVGVGDGVDIKAEDIIKTATGQKFKIKKKGDEREVSIGKFGLHHVYSYLISEAINKYVD